SSASARPSSSMTSVAITFAPAATRPRTCSAPMPRAAPVTSATTPSNEIPIWILLRQGSVRSRRVLRPSCTRPPRTAMGLVPLPVVLSTPAGFAVRRRRRRGARVIMCTDGHRRRLHEVEPTSMLKALGVTIAQLSERVSGAPTVRGLSDDDRAALKIHRAEWRRRLKTVAFLAVVFVAMVTLFSSLFHELMAREGRSYSWPTSVYWTLTTMTTLGFGDITFESDAGRIFSVVVLLSGSTFLLVMLPFVFIQFVFVPWMNERDRRRAPRSVPPSTSGHLILTGLGPVEAAVVERAEQAEVPYVILVDDIDLAGRIHDEGRRVMLGALDDPATYRNARVDQAAMVVATRNDPTNTNIA